MPGEPWFVLPDAENDLVRDPLPQRLEIRPPKRRPTGGVPRGFGQEASRRSRKAALCRRTSSLVSLSKGWSTVRFLPGERMKQAEIAKKTETPAPAEAGPTLTLTPASHGTDGFFLAVLERKAA